MENKLGQIWIETALYLLIGISLIGIFLAFATPKIQEQKDKVFFESSLESMRDLDNAILELRRTGVGNQKKVDFLIRQGQLRIEADNSAEGDDDALVLIVDESKYAASEVGSPTSVDVPGTNLEVFTQKHGDGYRIEISRYFDEDVFDLTYGSSGEDILREFNYAPTPYTFILKNMGRTTTGVPLEININEVSS